MRAASKTEILQQIMGIGVIRVAQADGGRSHVFTITLERKEELRWRYVFRAENFSQA